MSDPPSAAAAGSTSPGTAARPSASGACRASGSTTLESAHPSDWSRDDESERAHRGGCYSNDYWFCRAAIRNGNESGLRDYILGFRPSFRLVKR
jgi:formylglycine-generating enzyme required for sulfatase activity